MDITQEKITELKSKYPGGIFKGTINFNDEKGTLHTIEFIYRKPTMADVELHQKTAPKSPLVANTNIIQSMIVYPEPGPIIETLREYPTAAGRFVDDVIVPFFGENVQVKTEIL